MSADTVTIQETAKSTDSFTWGLGRRKSSIARVRVKPGTGNFIVNGKPFEEFVRVRAQHQVERDLGLVRRVLLRVLSARSLALRVPSLNASYFDFVAVESSADGRVVSGVCRGLPGPIVRWYQIVTETFIAEVLRRNGAEDHTIAWVSLDADGEAHGVPVFAARFRIELPA